MAFPIIDTSTNKLSVDNLPYAIRITNDTNTIPNTSAVYNALPTKVSDLTNDSGYITSNDIQDIYSYTETQTNKIYIDSNNNEFPIYRKIIELDLSKAIQVTIDGKSWYAVEHNISNFNKAFSFWLYKNTGSIQEVMTDYLHINNQYILFQYDPSSGGTVEINLEYIKISN